MEVLTNIKCPGCGDPIIADVFEYETETGRPTLEGFHAFCKPYTENWTPCDIPYMESVQLVKGVHQWMIDNKIDCRK